MTVAELFAGEKLPKEEGKVSAAVFEDGIAVAANEVRQKKKRYRGLLMIMVMKWSRWVKELDSQSLHMKLIYQR